MTDPIQLNARVFETLLKRTEDKTLDKADIEALQKAMVADGQLDAGEMALLEQLKNPKDAFTVAVQGHADIHFDILPNQLKFQNVDSALKAGLEFSPEMSRQWQNLLKAKQGLVSPDDLETMRRQAKTPHDLEFLQKFISGQKVESTDPSGLYLRYLPQGKNHRLDPASITQQLDMSVQYGFPQLFAQALNHRVPAIKLAAQARFEQVQDPVFKARTLEAMAGLYPQQKPQIIKALQSLLKQPNLTPSAQLAISRLHLQLDPGPAATEIMHLLKTKGSQIPITERQAALIALGDTVKKGDKELFRQVAGYYRQSNLMDEKNQLRSLLQGAVDANLGQSDPKRQAIGEAAQQALQSLESDAEAGHLKPVNSAEAQQTLQARKSLDSFLANFKKDSNYKKYITVSWEGSQNQQNLLKFGTPQQKAEITLMMMQSDEQQVARPAVKDILNSFTNRGEQDAFFNRLSESYQEPVDLHAYFGSEYAVVQAHIDSVNQPTQELRHALSQILDDNEKALASRYDTNSLNANKGVFLARVLDAYQDRKLSQGEVRRLVQRTVDSLMGPEQYEAVLKSMAGQSEGLPRFDERALAEALGQDLFRAMKAGLGKQSGQLLKQSQDERLALQAQEFFDYVAHFDTAQDGSLSTDNLVRQNPAISRNRFFQAFLNNGDYQHTLDDRLKIAELIANGKINVSRVPSNFANRYLFRKVDIGIVDAAGDLKGKDFLHGSIQQRARQFVAIDHHARIIFETTQNLLKTQVERLHTIAAAPAALDASLKKLQADIEPYQDLLKQMTDSGILANLGKSMSLLQGVLPDLIKSKINAQHTPRLSEPALSEALNDLVTKYQLLDKYGTDGSKAAQIMNTEAANMEAHLKQHFSGKYEDQANHQQYMSQALAMYQNKDHDLLQQEYAKALKGLSAEDQEAFGQVEGKIDSLNQQMGIAKEVIGEIAGALTGMTWIVPGMKLASKAMKHADNADAVALGFRSLEAQRKELNDLIVDAAALGAGEALNQVKKARLDKLEKEIDQTFNQLRSEARSHGLESHQDLFEAYEVLQKNAKYLVGKDIDSLKALVGFTQELAKGDPAKAFATLVVKGSFAQAIKKVARNDQVADRIPKFEIIAAQLLKQSVNQTANALDLLQPVSQKLTADQARQAQKILDELHAQSKSFDNLPRQVSTFDEFVKVLQRLAEPQAT